MVVLITVIFVSFATNITLYKLKPQYQASATLGVMINEAAAEQIKYDELLANQLLIKSYKDFIKSRAVISEVIKDLNLIGMTNQDLEKITQVQLNPDSSMIKILVRHENPLLARDIANKISYVFIQKSSELLKVNNIKIVDIASVNKEPVYPQTNLIIALSFLAGVFISLIFILIITYVDDTIRDSKEIALKTRLNLVGVIPDVKIRLRLKMSKQLIEIDHYSRQLAEDAFQLLITNLQLNFSDMKVFSVVSFNPREGKTSVAMNAAIAATKIGKRVLYIDANLRRKQNMRFRKDKSLKGLSDLCEGVEIKDIICQTNIDNLEYVTSGEKRVDPVKFLNSRIFEWFLERLSNQYDLIFIDTSPIVKYIDGAIISKKSSGVLIVAKAHKTQYKHIECIKSHLNIYDATIVGTVINRVAIKEYKSWLLGEGESSQPVDKDRDKLNSGNSEEVNIITNSDPENKSKLEVAVEKEQIIYPMEDENELETSDSNSNDGLKNELELGDGKFIQPVDQHKNELVMGESSGFSTKQKICIIGLGYIGLPTAIMFATHGHKTIGVDINQNVVDDINKVRKTSQEPFLNIFLQAAVKSGNLKAQLVPEESDVFIIAVPTPIKPDKTADMSFVIDALECILPYLREGNIVILESTSPPGTVKDYIVPLLSKSGLKIGEQLMVAHSPERVLPGRLLNELVENSRIVGGINKKSAEMTKDLYKTFVNGDIHLTDATTAEMCKIIENTFRDVNIAFANELAILCEKVGIDAWEVIELCNMHPRVNIHQPGPGVGGHCIAVDPWFIVEKYPEATKIISLARRTNDSMPEYVADKIDYILGDIYGEKKITILGITYKPDVDDMRESPIAHLLELLIQRGYLNISIVDPYIKNNEVKTEKILSAALNSDLILLGVNHREFAEIDFSEVASVMRNKNLLDTRNYLNKKEMEQLGFRYYLLGRRLEGEWKDQEESCY